MNHETKLLNKQLNLCLKIGLSFHVIVTCRGDYYKGFGLGLLTTLTQFVAIIIIRLLLISTLQITRTRKVFSLFINRVLATDL
jgi:hypothetical protein